MSDEERDGRGWRKVDRRGLLKLGLAAGAVGGAGLGIGFYGGLRYERYKKRVPPREGVFSPSVFLAIDPDGTTTIWVTRSEMGQGVRTALPMILADELDADWSRVRLEQAPASRSFGNQGTMASASVRSMFGELREAGAIARAMLVTAAARTWEVDETECATRDGAVFHTPTGRHLGYGPLASLAGTLDVPPAPPLKAPSDHRRIGEPTRRLDAQEKVDGRGVFGLDVRRPGMLFASIERPHELGAVAGAHDAAAARAVPGVRDVVETEFGVAVIADHTHAAFEGRRMLSTEWARGPHAGESSARVQEALRSATEGGGARVTREGDVDQALAGAARTLEALYEVPYLAHACMEPINATVRFDGQICEVWAPTQDPQAVQAEVAEQLGLALPDVHVRVTLLGGGFGRRTVPVEVREAVEVARHTNPRPVQLVWTREDDVRHDFYRCAAAHRFTVGLDEEGEIVAWRDFIASPTRRGSQASAGQVDDLAVEGAREIPYRVSNMDVRWGDVASPIPTGIWRSVGHSYNAFAVESMIDEVARATDRDPVDLRLSLLAQGARERAVLQRVAEISGWGDTLPEGVARGVAVHACFGSVCAQVAEVSLRHDRPVVRRVWAAVECGLAVNPLGVAAQIEGGIVFGLTAALFGEIHVEEGRVRESNFHDVPLLRMGETPSIEVSIVEGDGTPGGVGEVGVPPIAPAVASALSRLTGAPVRRLPISRPS